MHILDEDKFIVHHDHGRVHVTYSVSTIDNHIVNTIYFGCAYNENLDTYDKPVWFVESIDRSNVVSLFKNKQHYHNAKARIETNKGL